MSPVTGQCVGIDISEDFLDVYLHPVGKEVRIPHSDEGSASLVALLREYEIDRVVMESTGGLQRRLVGGLQEAGYSVSVVKPERIWAYRRLVGRVARTDRIDARLIAEYASTMCPEGCPEMRLPAGQRRVGSGGPSRSGIAPAARRRCRHLASLTIKLTRP